MTPAILALAVRAKDKKARQAAEENKNYVMKTLNKTYVLKDYEAFKSPVTGEMIDGRRALREHLKETGCRIVEPSEAKAHNIN